MNTDRQMKLKLLYLAMTIGLSSTAVAQDFGLSFSYFVPRNGYFSTPISPFSIRGVGVDLTPWLAVETGASLYRMSGLNMKDLPFESKEPLIGPNFTLLVPVELVLQLRSGAVQFDLKGGGFFFFGMDNKINYGNFDRAIREFENWAVANADLSADNNPGFGYHAGAELTVYATEQFGVSLECNYLVGQAKFPLAGQYSGGNGSLETREVDYSDAKIDFTGLEFSIGLIFSAGGNNGYRKSRRRR